MTLAPGIRLGPYEIVSPLGAGGMGEVWRATDTRLDRSVAIKILPDGLAQNEQFRTRFEREAKTISSLNHPNICTLFDVGHEGGSHFLVMELIDGESLAERLQRGALPADQVLRFGAQIADALDRAHRQGIVHRDLKPGNVMLTKGGAKLLDFGLARSGVDASPIQGLSDMTQARPLTQEGTLLGTFQYMAPEQLEGHEADARTDIFGLGALLYEMATGKRAFEGASRTSLIAAIVSSHPTPISQVTPMTPPALDHVVRKCIEKDPEDRWQSAHDVASELRWISEAGSQAGVSAPVALRRKTRERLAWSLAGGATAMVAAMGMFLASPEPPRRMIESAIITPPSMQVAFNGAISLSPDGKTAAFIFNDERGDRTLWVRPLDSRSFRRLEGAAGASHTFWAPDSRRIGFFAFGKLKTIDLQGGAVTTVCEVSAGRGASWNGDGTILVTTASIGPLMMVPASGGTLVPLTKLRPGDTNHRWPFFLPDGKTFVFLALNELPAKTAVCQATLDRPDDIKVLFTSATSTQFVAPDILLFVRDNALLAQRYDSKRARMAGDPVTISDRVGLTDRFDAQFSAANDGTLLIQRGAGFQLSELVWVDRSGKSQGAVGDPGLFFSPSLSRDGRRLAVDLSSTTDGQGDIWIFDLTRKASSRLTYERTNESAPQWFPGDKRILYFGVKNGRGDIFELPSGGTGQARVLISDDREKRPSDISRDGQWVVFNSVGGPVTGGMDIWAWSASDKKARPWLATPFAELCARLSPDGKWIAYQSDESGRMEVYVRAFPESEEKWMISVGGGVMPTWRGDGREMFYLSLERKMMAVPFNPGGSSLQVGAPVMLFDARVRMHPTLQYDVSSDGQRFLLNRQLQGTSAEPVALLQNWDVKLPAR